MLAKSVVAPVDRVKILFQVTNETFSFKKVGSSKLLVVHACSDEPPPHAPDSVIMTASRR